jgi:hypothetical protein
VCSAGFAQSSVPRRLELAQLLGGFRILCGVAQSLTDENKEQQGKAGSQGGQDGDEGFFWFALASARDIS